MNKNRKQIKEYISDNPGVYFKQIQRQLDLATGQLQYHLHKLKKQNKITEKEVYGHTHYFGQIYTDSEKNIIALLRRETTQQIILYLIQYGSTKPKKLSEKLDISRSTLEWHLKKLKNKNVINKKYTGDTVKIILKHPEKIAKLVDKTDISLPKTMVDRFTKLIDRILYK